MLRRFTLLTISALAVLLTPVPATRADDGSPLDGAFADAVTHAQKRTVKIFGAAIGRSPGYGTGLVVSPQGDILTAQGVYLAGDSLRVTLPDGTTHYATVKRRSDSLQAAMIKIEAETPDYFDLAQQPVVEQGDWILAVSNAFKVAD